MSKLMSLVGAPGRRATGAGRARGAPGRAKAGAVLLDFAGVERLLDQGYELLLGASDPPSGSSSPPFSPTAKAIESRRPVTS